MISHSKDQNPLNLLELGFIALSFLLVVVFSILKLILWDYIGFVWDSVTNKIQVIFVETNTLEVDDQLISITNPNNFTIILSNYAADVHIKPFNNSHTGDTYIVKVQRDEEVIDYEWVIPQKTFNEFFFRIFDFWWLGLIFWLAGLITRIYIWPREENSILMVVFFCLTAIWISAGSASISRELASPQILRLAIWLSLPVGLHLHWRFPRPLFHIPKFIIILIYTICGLLGIIQIATSLINSSLHFYCLIVEIGTIFLILAYRFITQPVQRHLLREIFFSGLLTVILISILAIVQVITNSTAGGITLLVGLIFFPIGYFYSIHKYQIGHLGFRANYALSTLIYLVICVVVLIIEIASVMILDNAYDRIFISSSLIIISFIFSIVLLDPFRSIIEDRLMKINIRGGKNIESKISSILQVETMDELKIIINDVLTSLLIQKSVLVFQNRDEYSIFYTRGIKTEEVNNELNKIRDIDNLSFPWAELVFPISHKGKFTGIWVIGEIYPDGVIPKKSIDYLNDTSLMITAAFIENFRI